MKIINETKKIILAENATLANTPLKRMKGLLGRKSLEDKEALVIKPCNSIHTFFMNFPIDVLFVDKENKIVKIMIGLQPFRLSPVCRFSSYVIELPVGAVSANKAETGDLISFQ